jgi:predicted DNA binding CopG/RHH family protein
MRYGLLEPDTGGKESKFMKNRILYTDEPLGDLRVVKDFLPPPHELVLEEETVKVTIGLSRSSVEYFKQEARRHHTAYQKMIRRLLDVYAAHYDGKTPTGRSTPARRKLRKSVR